MYPHTSDFKTYHTAAVITVPNPGDTALNKADKNSCLQGAFILMRRDR